MEKKKGKYALYFFGIVLLMVMNSIIHTLIATSINHWNQQRKDAMMDAQNKNDTTGEVIMNKGEELTPAITKVED